jgi:membrane protease subunit HflC
VKKTVTIIVVIAVAIILFLITGPFYIIDEGEQAVVVQLGRIVRVVIDPGLRVKVPFVDNVVKYPKKILAWDGEAQRLPTAENQFIWVDSTARWLITDPQLFYESVGTITQAHSRLDDVIDSEIRKVVSRNSLREAVRNSNVINEIERTNVYASEEEGAQEVEVTTLTTFVYEEIGKGRSVLSSEMFITSGGTTPEYGIKLIDIVIRQIKYSDDLTESVFRRMIKERNQIAQAFRSDGEGKKAVWMGQTQRELLSVRSGAYREAEIIRGGADAEAAAIYALAYNRNQDFFEFWKAIESYRIMLPKFNKTLTTEPDYFNYLYSPQGR